ncbi:MAG TPA: chemotaxis protein CheA [Steroidobacteraceae bacterium]|nr:chemotaxis protein CheA [Steroidobacteraceae bacterium]
MNVDEALPGFFVEAADLLVGMEAGLLECSRAAPGPETINLIFRSAHTIKGSAGLFGLDAIVRFVHVVETALDAVRLGKLTMSDDLLALLLRAKDHIAALVARVESGDRVAAELEPSGEQITGALKRLSGSAGTSEGNRGADTTAQWQVSIRFGSDMLKAGMDPLAFIRYLATFATLERVTVTEDDLPAVEAFDPETCYLGFEIDLRTAESKARIEAAFELVRDDCTLRITSAAHPEPASRGDAASPAERAAGSARAPEGDRKKPARVAATHSIRVDAEKLDHLITRIGELIIAAAGAQLAARQARDGKLVEHTSTLAGLVEQVRESALQLRMVKIGGVFDRFKRVVHDISRELGKEIHLVIKGEDTELDKTLVEQIADPLTHLVRNAMDHGIEAADTRAARGKPPAGTLTLNAFHDSGSVVIEVGDDGGGLRREKILAKALERGLVEPGRELTDREAFDLIFEPGFSTAEHVTNLSGRGVGMDVVKRNITALRGDVTLRSVEGAGTTVSIRLPLTLAIINGFQVGVGRSSFVLPLEVIDEVVELGAVNGHDLMDLRGEVLPFVRLRQVFGTPEAAARRESVVVVRHGLQRAGLVVDALLGELQTVIKPLGKMFRAVDCVTGSSILGNGEVALILDVPALVRRAAARNRHSSGNRVGELVC